MEDVRCTHCGKIYDLGKVEVIARYADCSLFKTPCCGRQVDDRRDKSLPDFRPVADERRVWEEYEASGELRFPRG